MNDKFLLLATSYLPSVLYIRSIINEKQIFIHAYENYIKQTFRNRTYISAANGVLSLSIPIKKKKQNNEYVKDMRIDYATNWQKIHLRSIESAYNSSPFFIYYGDLLRPFYESKYDFLIDFNTEILDTVLNKIMKLDIHISFSKMETEDKLQINNCGIFCMPKNFSKETQTSPIEILKPYPQVFSNKHDFISNLSIIDLIFNEGNLSLSYLKNQAGL